MPTTDQKRQARSRAAKRKGLVRWQGFVTPKMAVHLNRIFPDPSLTMKEKSNANDTDNSNGNS